ncbi:MAG: aldehyde dehydrogenase family protein [Candidatus Protistobacter heckmanni]|nr:aldehyde dehydrogenase family protein [Candidatus Protistobacter heckmanni]
MRALILKWNPATGEVYGRVAQASAADVGEAIATAHAARTAWAAIIGTSKPPAAVAASGAGGISSFRFWRRLIISDTSVTRWLPLT